MKYIIAWLKTRKKHIVITTAIVCGPLVAWVSLLLSVGGADFLTTWLDYIMPAFSIDVIFYLILVSVTSYLVLGYVIFFMWGSLGLRGVFYIVEAHIAAALALLLLSLYINLKYHVSFAACLGELYLSDDLSIVCIINLDLLANIGSLLVIALTAVVFTFGVEYMTREAFSYSVLTTLVAFSASIVWFILSYDFGLMSIFWELSGLFSLLLVDTFYSRVRTTQAVSRTYSISRFSDYWLFLGVAEVAATFDTESLSAVFCTLKVYAAELVSLTSAAYECTLLNFVAACALIAASCKCAQFILFVWLPDAMEAPTPASALIHSSTLVVMGIFMLLRLSPVFRHASTVLSVALIVGALTIVYGATSAIRTSDLKKAVAYSTISQIGYLYCCCGLLAWKEALIYLIVHAVCKAMLFIFVGYAVHTFKTTSLRKMGGLFFMAPDVSVCVFALCAILAGAPYTIGFVAKELIISHLYAVYTPIMCLVCFCWAVAFVCTPIYLYRVCVLPFFGRPRGTSRVFKQLALLKNKSKHLAIGSFDLDKLNSPLFFFMYQTRDLYITSRLTSIIHTLVILCVMYLGEFAILLVSGFFNTSGTLLSGSGEDLSTYAVTSLQLNAFSLVKQIQVLILSLMYTIAVYVTVVIAKRARSSWLLASYAVLAVLAVLVNALLVKVYLLTQLC